MVALFCLVSLGLRLGWAEEVNVKASVERKEVALGEPFLYQISISAGESVNVEPPRLDDGVPGFQVQGSSSSSQTSSTFENGRFKTRQVRVFNYQLVAIRKGAARIPAFDLRVNDRNYRTNILDLIVTAERRAPPRGQARQAPNLGDDGDEMEELFQQMMQRQFGGAPGGRGAGGGGAQGVNPQPPVNPNDAFFIQAQVDKTKVHVGEQITANFYLVTRGQIRDIDTLRYPDLKGFWKEDLEMATRLNFENVVINNVAYQRALLVSYALFPIKAGTSTIDGYTAKCTVLTPSAFGFGHAYVFTKSSTPIPIEVEDVPSPKPANYTGAVGVFRARAQFEPATGTVNQPVTLRIRFEGKGNAKLIELPKLDLPPSLEFYDQKSTAQFAKDGSSFKEFEVLMIPRAPGVFKINPVAIAAFDPSTRKFTDVASLPLELTVTGSANAPVAPTLPGQSAPNQVAAPPPSAASEPALPALANDLRGFEIPPALRLSLSALAYALVFAGLGVYGVRQLRGRPKKASLNAILRRRLQTVETLEAAQEYRRVGVELTNTAYYILGQLSGQGAHQELERLLENTPPSLRHELSADVRKLLTSCEALSFAPEDTIKELTRGGQLEQLKTDFARVLGRAIELAEI